MINFKSIQVAGITALLIMASLLTTHSAQAQSRSLEVTVPFEFFAGDVRLPAGEYQVEPTVGNFVRLYNPTTHASFAFATISISKGVREVSSPKLIFTKYGVDHFLSEMWWGHGGAGITPIRSKLEMELAKAVRPVRIEAQAHRAE
jgi:hypothetical protein